jgi:hypothetical protein
MAAGRWRNMDIETLLSTSTPWVDFTGIVRFVSNLAIRAGTVSSKQKSFDYGLPTVLVGYM